MFRAWLPLVLLACVVAKAASPADAPAAPGGPASVSIECGRLIDGLAAKPLLKMTVSIRDGRVAAVTHGYRADAAAPVINLRSYTCLPGLIDLHTHLVDRPEDFGDLKVYFRRKQAEQLALSKANASATLLAGFTTVRNLGAYIAWSDRDLRDAIERGDFPGPRMQISGPYLSIPGGGGDLRVPGVSEADTPARVRGGMAHGREQFTARATQLLDGGAEVLKVIASGAVLALGGVPGAPEMEPDELAAVVAVAHARGARVAAHAHGAQSIKDAIRAGADTIEHASMIDDEGIELARQRRVTLVMDVYNGDYIDSEGRRLGWPAEFMRKNLETTEIQRRGFTRALRAGATIAYGTDAGVYPHGLNARQLAIMVERGMTPMQAIQSATSVAARVMGWEERVGALVPGRFGDLVAVRGDPLRNVRLLENVAVVVKGGVALKQP